MYENGFNAGMFGAFFWVLVLGTYFYFSFALYKIAQKAGHERNAWWAFVPIMQSLLLCRTAAKPDWWFVLQLIPIINIVAFAILWIETAKNVGHSALWGVLTLLPFLNFISVGIMAFTGAAPRLSTPPPSQPNQPRKPEETPVA